MYSVLVVDDEKNIRERLVRSFPWSETGFQVIGSARDGREALDMMERHVPDVVLTDILMPEMNGIELAKAIQAAHPQIKVLILSAYDDFKYAQDAIRYGVKGYLLKPLMKSEFVDMLQGIALELRKDEELEKGTITGADSHEEAMLIELVKGNNVHPHAAPWLHDYLRIAVCSFERRFVQELGLSMRQFITQAARDFWKASDTPVLFYGNHLVLFIHDKRPISKYELKGKFERYSEFVKESIFSSYGKQCILSIGIGNMMGGAESAGTSFNQAIFSLSYSSFYEQGSIIFYQDLSAPQSEGGFKERTNEQISVAMDTLIQSVFTKNKNETASHLRGFFDALEQGKRLSLVEIQIVFSECILTLLLKAKDRRIILPSLDKKQALEQIYAAESLADLKKWFKATLESIMDHPGQERDHDENRYVLLAKQHVHSRLSEKITLEEMAQQLFIHPAYFSSIFKKETGQNFIDYVNEVRVRKAVELLKSNDCKIKEISITVGFHNHSYFNKVFKKVIGVNPLEFRSHYTS
ncbi:response regulator [Paenibacillus sp. H1-7]|uniref:response regulator transcription factor n=1 Tax=Paenibacillus sp. H1-7 TaxID=2282849 RepID=UPI001EF7C46A|nr:response regulator [Paenibacillus sp. H1-7]ULL14955.1 response regulator [Paenibacillus sp. H1-7]